MTRSTRWVLYLCGGLSTLMAAYHFYLPTMFHWENFVGNLPEMIRWALFSLNFFFSVLLLAGGVSTIMIAHRKTGGERAASRLLFSMTIFWLANLGYQIVRPMPMPSFLHWLQYFLLSFAALNSILYGYSFLQSRQLQTQKK